MSNAKYVTMSCPKTMGPMTGMSLRGPKDSGKITVVMVLPSAGLPKKFASPVPKMTNASPATI
jgi:hypothetical protein